ncbi:MAG: PHP domain-containing protein [Acidimicrobiales bacterium]
MRIDLHTHSTASDGTDRPAELVANAGAAGLDVLAITDHDTVAGWDEASAAVPPTVSLVRGAEISCAAHGRSIHLLAYLFDPDEPTFAEERRKLATDRVRRARAMVAKLQELGVPVTWDRVRRAADEGTIGRPHIAQALVELGVVPDVSSAFTPEWIARDGRAYVEKYALDPGYAIRLVTGAGGVAVLAHPMSSARVPVRRDEQLVERLAEVGLAGVEVDHPDHDDEARRYLREVASELGLLVTGSSDYHGANKPTRLGANTTDPDAYGALVDRATGLEVVGR